MIEKASHRQSGFLSRVRQNYPNLSPSFRKVADYILEHYREVAFLTASKVAAKTGVSESVVVRLAVALGYSGYPEMLQSVQELVRFELNPQVSLDADRGEFDSELSPQEILQRVLSSDMMNLRVTQENPVNRSIQEAVEVLDRAKAVYCLGFRGLNNLAGLLSFLLHMTGISTYVIHQGDATMYQELNRIDPDDVFVTFAFHRYTRRTTHAVELAKQAGSTTIVITDSLTSPAAQVADIVLVAAVESDSFFNSYCAAVGLINALVICCAAHNAERCRQSLEQIDALLPTEDFYD